MDDLVDQQLLQQFSCMGTTDKDELVRQLKRILNNKLTAAAAQFFLEMNNWNLQAAVGSYFDFESPAMLPSMSLMRDNYSADTINVPPSTRINQVWWLHNNGTNEWPYGCHFQFSGGDIMSETHRIPVEPLLPNKHTSVTVSLISPNVPGTYQSNWRMVTPNGSYFGDTIWVIMTVIEPSDADLSQQMDHLNTHGMGFHADTSVNNPFEAPQLFQEQTINDSQNKKLC